MEESLQQTTRTFVQLFAAENAPGELPFVEPVCAAYFKAASGPSLKRSAGGMQFVDPELSAFILPIVTEAVAATLKAVIEKWFDRKSKQLNEKKIRAAILASAKDLKPAMREKLADQFLRYLKDHPDVLAAK